VFGEEGAKLVEVPTVGGTGVRREVALDGEILLEAVDPFLHGSELSTPGCLLEGVG
jgi:hypothetical protein